MDSRNQTETQDSRKVEQVMGSRFLALVDSEFGKDEDLNLLYKSAPSRAYH